LDKRETDFPQERVRLGMAAKQMTDYFHNPNTPIVVSNACISGVCAQIQAMRELESGHFDYVVTVGADVQSAFIVSGFQSFKALSVDPCKPFDANRTGLNLGDAAATIIYTRKDNTTENDWVACRGAIRNDANHISGPSRTGEGSYRALRAVLGDVNPEKLAFINTHGTATLYNDEMESVAIERTGLAQVPVNGLKGYYGHTMGAAGILETILSMQATDDNNILATRGFETLGVTHPLMLSNQNQPTDKRAFIKLLSGFGGCNAALLMAKGGAL
jgi:3-oxoacyl-[acyl-carrier-protein] synthase-1